MKLNLNDLDAATADALIGTVWGRAQMPPEIRELHVFGGGTERALLVSATPARPEGRYGYCFIECPVSAEDLDLAAERAVCASWFDSSYAA